MPCTNFPFLAHCRGKIQYKRDWGGIFLKPLIIWERFWKNSIALHKKCKKDILQTSFKLLIKISSYDFLADQNKKIFFFAKFSYIKEIVIFHMRKVVHFWQFKWKNTQINFLSRNFSVEPINCFYTKYRKRFIYQVFSHYIENKILVYF